MRLLLPVIKVLLCQKSLLRCKTLLLFLSLVICSGTTCYAESISVMTSEEKLIKYSNEGYDKAKLLLGLKYIYGMSVKIDYDKGISLLSKIEDDSDAPLAIGYAYEMKKEYDSARKYYEKAISMGNKKANLNLGILYKEGYGVKKDYTKALSLLDRAKDSDPQALLLIGELYENGNGVEKDTNKALKYYNDAAEKKVALSYFKLDGLNKKVARISNIKSLLNSALNKMKQELLWIVSTIMAYIFYIKTKRTKKLNYNFKNISIFNVENKIIEGLSISFKTMSIDRISLLNIVLWNSGNAAIDSTDSVNLEPLQIKLSNGQILGYKIKHMSNISNNFRLDQINDQQIGINFDYIDGKDAVVVQILHDCKSDSDVKIDGRFKEFGTPVRRQLPTNNGLNKATNIFKIIMSLVVILAFPVYSYVAYGELLQFINILTSIGATVFIITAVIALTYTMPKGVNIDYDSFE